MQFLRATLLAVLWVLLLGSGLCVAFSALGSSWIVTVAAAGVTFACVFAIEALQKAKKAETPPREPNGSN